jgi:hypothetical protein
MQTVWVGFDMDECLGEFLSLWPFCEIVTERLFKAQQKEYLSAVARRIEESDQHWLFRPGINAVIEQLVQAQTTGKLYGCFILSNNGSQHVVDCIRQILNLRAIRMGSRKDLFLTGWSRNSSCRKGDMKKSLEEIETCLASEGFPGVRKLLFFDDMNHVLSREIPDYIQVSAYTYYTPVDLVQHILSPVFQQLRIAPSILQAVMKRAKVMEHADRKDSWLRLSSPSPTKWTDAMDAILRFFHSPKRTHKRSGTRKGKSHSIQKTKKSKLWTRY